MKTGYRKIRAKRQTVSGAVDFYEIDRRYPGDNYYVGRRYDDGSWSCLEKWRHFVDLSLRLGSYQMAVLRWLVQHEYCERPGAMIPSTPEIARAHGFTLQKTGEILRALERKGLVTKAPGHQSRGREAVCHWCAHESIARYAIELFEKRLA